MSNPGPTLQPRPEPFLKEQAARAIRSVGSGMNPHIVGFLKWLVGDAQEPPTRPKTPLTPLADLKGIILVPDTEWNSARERAEADGQTLTDLTRSLLQSYRKSSLTLEYRVIPRNSALGEGFEGIHGDYDEIRPLYPSKHWDLEKRETFEYMRTGPKNKYRPRGEQPAARPSDRHRYPPIPLRPDPDLRARAAAAVAEIGSDLTSHIIWFLEWVAGYTDTLPTRPGEQPRSRESAGVIRIPADEWDATVARANEDGRTINEVAAHLLRAYHQCGIRTEYRATPIDPQLGRTVDNIAGEHSDVRRLFPAKYWDIDEREVFGYQPVRRTKG
ncbi:hypothetical protein [Mycobacteroides abscessus]|uniref:hypothetical protein n=1 Tax=Mycobacteroides abscessus TaxID=36809 RepID=UPI0018966FDB